MLYRLASARLRAHIGALCSFSNYQDPVSSPYGRALSTEPHQFLLISRGAPTPHTPLHPCGDSMETPWSGGDHLCRPQNRPQYHQDSHATSCVTGLATTCLYPGHLLHINTLGIFIQFLPCPYDSPHPVSPAQRNFADLTPHPTSLRARRSQRTDFI